MSFGAIVGCMDSSAIQYISIHQNRFILDSARYLVPQDSVILMRRNAMKITIATAGDQCAARQSGDPTKKYPEEEEKETKMMKLNYHC